MTKILILSDDKDLAQECKDALPDYDYVIEVVEDDSQVEFSARRFMPDLALVDARCKKFDIKSVSNNLKFYSQSDDIQLLMVTDGEDLSSDPMSRVDGYIIRPFKQEVLVSIINAHMRTKKRLDMIFSKTSELAKSLYQLNVMYDTSSQLAGSLDKQKLINVMKEGIERSISFALSAVLLVEDGNIKLVLNSLHPVSERLEQAIKLRMMINYKNLFESQKSPVIFDIKDIEVQKTSKHSDSSYDIKVLDYDTLFSPISTSDNFFGLIEVFREQKFTGEDATCFQTLVRQVSLPLESAILYEELKETNKKLEKLEQLKSEFISIVSHELRTPLTAIKNSLKIILSGKSGALPETMSKFLNMAGRNVDRLSGIINDLLDLSKIEAGKMDYRFEVHSLKTPLDNVMSTFDDMAKEKNITLQVDSLDALPEVYIDVDRIEQVLANLVANAIKFTHEGGQIQVKASVLDSDFLKVTVKDTGIGIKQEDVEKVFDKFKQIESSLVRKVGGTGLGLPIAKQLVEAHRGTIWADSEDGIGSAFSFTVPVVNNQNMFVLELDKCIQQAKYNHSSFALLKVVSAEASFIEELSSGSSMFQKYDKAKIFSDGCKMYLILPDANKMVADILVGKIKSFGVKKTGESQDDLAYNNSIAAGFVLYPEDAIDSDEALAKLNDSLPRLGQEEGE